MMLRTSQKNAKNDAFIFTAAFRRCDLESYVTKTQKNQKVSGEFLRKGF